MSTTGNIAAAETVDTPTGPFTVIARRDAVIASGWTGDPDELLSLLSPSLRPERLEGTVPRRFIKAVRDYHRGKVEAIDGIAVDQPATPLLTQARTHLRAVTPGEPITYGELARRAGNPDAVRAVARACSRNTTALFVPCHRVVPSSGGVGRFGWGSEVKAWLLDHEREAAA